MIKEIRLTWADIEAIPPEDYSMMRLLKDRGFPCEGTILLKPKAGLTYYEFHDPKTCEIVVQWVEDSPENTQ